MATVLQKVSNFLQWDRENADGVSLKTWLENKYKQIIDEYQEKHSCSNLKAIFQEKRKFTRRGLR